LIGLAAVRVIFINACGLVIFTFSLASTNLPKISVPSLPLTLRFVRRVPRTRTPPSLWINTRHVSFSYRWNISVPLSRPRPLLLPWTNKPLVPSVLLHMTTSCVRTPPMIPFVAISIQPPSVSFVNAQVTRSTNATKRSRRKEHKRL